MGGGCGVCNRDLWLLKGLVVWGGPQNIGVTPKNGRVRGGL